MKKFIYILIWLSLTNITHGAEGNGETLLQDCQSNVRMLDQGEAYEGSMYPVIKCAMFITGVRKTIAVAQELDGEGIDFFERIKCVPKITTGQISRLVVQYLKKHPEELHESDISQVIMALMVAFPCK